MDIKSIPEVDGEYPFAIMATDSFCVPINLIPDWIGKEGDEFIFTRRGWSLDKISATRTLFVETMILRFIIGVGIGLACCKVISRHKVNLYNFHLN